MTHKKKSLWQVTREYAGIAEAGGMKNVVCSLSEGLHKLSWDITVFMPLYGCTMLNNLTDFHVMPNISSEIFIKDTGYRVVYADAYRNGVHIIFIVAAQFTEKMGIYTYTRLEEAIHPENISGRGHRDTDILNALFQKAVLDYGVVAKKCPDIFHCQDAHAACIPFIARNDEKYRSLYKDSRFVITIHNAGEAYHQSFRSMQDASDILHIPVEMIACNCPDEKPIPFLLSQDFATMTTVSPWYATELCNPENIHTGGLSKYFFERNTSITGITNGIDYNNYNPTDTHISTLPYAFDPLRVMLDGKYGCRKIFLDTYRKSCNEKTDGTEQYGVLSEGDNNGDDLVYFVFHGRMAHQKGVDILADAVAIVLSQCDTARFIIIAQGTKELEDMHSAMAQTYTGKYIYFRGYEKTLSRLCIAVADFIVLPSVFEPCGLEDFIAQIYATVPIAHACGGLKKIIDEKTGFLYDINDAKTLADMLLQLIEKKKNNPDLLNPVIFAGAHHVKNTYSWEKVIEEQYIPLFLSLED